MASPLKPTRDRIVEEGMRLFGEHGFEATRITAIEEAVGLAPGSGGLYKHFRSKAEILAAGVAAQIAVGQEFQLQLDGAEGGAELSAVSTRERVRYLALAALDRLDRGGGLVRLMMRDLRRFPDLMRQVGEVEIRQMAQASGVWLAEQEGASERDWEAVATVLTSSVVGYWLLRDAFGEFPSNIDEARFADAVADLAVSVLTD